MIELEGGNQTENQIELQRTQSQEYVDDHEEKLHKSLALFEFSSPLPKKRSNILRIFYNNCNGVEINNTIGVQLKQKRDKIQYNYLGDTEAPTKVDSLVRQMKVWEVDVVNLAEMCVAWEKRIPRRTIQQITHKYDQTSCWTVATSKIDLGSYVKPGGTGTLALGNSNGLIVERGVDPWQMGRWSYVLFGGVKLGVTLLVVTGYCTGHRTGIPGEKTAWAQQQAMLIKEGRTVKPNEAFVADLSTWLRSYQKPGMELFVSLDANERWHEKALITKFASNFGLCSINQECQLPDTHPNIANIDRSTTIDYCLCSPLVMENVVYAAAAPYELETLGNHRGILVDLDMQNLLGTRKKRDNIPFRKLVTTCPRTVDKYLSRVEKSFDKQNIFQRSTKLLKRVTHGHTDIGSIMRQYEALDKEVFGICTKAEQKCKPTYAGKFEWSPALARAIKQLRYWRHRLRTDTKTIIVDQMGEELDIPYEQLSTFVIQQMVNISRETLKNVQKDAQQHRKNHLEELAQMYADQNNLSQQQAVIELLSHEETRETFKTLRQSLKPNHRRQMKTLWSAMDDNGNYIKDFERKTIYTEKQQVHAALLKRNADHLGQAGDTPFAKGRWKKSLKWDGSGYAADDILTGNILNDRRFTASMQLYLECLKVQDLSRLNVVRPDLALEEYAMFWKKKREKTVTSPYGLHIGHYKASLHKLSILNVHRILLLIPFKTGMVPSRWRRTVQTMLEKEPGAPWIHRLRIIELFDAQANAGFQIFVGRRMMRHAVQKEYLQSESFGSTPGKMATSAIVQKILTIDQLRIERRAGGIFDCDATGCYDRILPPLASVHLQALGLHRSIGTFLARLMFQAKRHVRTGHGVSKQHISTTKKQVLYGIGQGNGGGPAMWIAHLTVMFSALSAVCHGFAMTCVEQLSRVFTVGTGYVDNVTLGISIPRDQSQTETKVHRHIKRIGQLWERLLFITGGRLELSKCFWVPITWKWRQGIPYQVIKTKQPNNSCYGSRRPKISSRFLAELSKTAKNGLGSGAHATANGLKKYGSGLNTRKNSVKE